MNFLLYMSVPAQIAIVIAIFSGLSVLGLYLVRRLVPLERLKKNHEVAGFTFGVIGAFYGLLLAFVIVAAWERFDRADANVEQEGVALVTLYRLSKGFSAPAGADMQRAIREYTRHLVDVEWPSMSESRFRSIDESMSTLKLWQVVQLYKPTSPHESLMVDKSFDQLSKLTDETSLRHLYAEEDLPSVVWLVIYAGLLITIGFSYFFGLERFPSQALMCATSSTLLGLTILAIQELAHPYQGSVVVSAQPLTYALARMDDMDKIAFSDLDRDGPQLRASARPKAERQPVSPGLRPGASLSSARAAFQPVRATSASAACAFQASTCP
jgi:hypothetical protein